MSGHEQRRARAHHDQAVRIGRHRHIGTIADLQRHLGGGELGEGLVQATVAGDLQRLLEAPGQEPPLAQPEGEDPGRHVDMAEDEVVAPARPAQLVELGRRPRAGDGGAGDAAAGQPQGEVTQHDQDRPGSIAVRDEAKGSRQVADIGQARAAGDATGRQDDDVAQAAGTVLEGAQIEPAEQPGIELAAGEAGLDEGGAAHRPRAPTRVKSSTAWGVACWLSSRRARRSSASARRNSSSARPALAVIGTHSSAARRVIRAWAK